MLAQIRIEVKTDSIPETNEEFKLVLDNVTTEGISQTGGATLDPSGHTAVLLIGASNDPHGVVEFSEIIQPIRVKESDGSAEVRIVRHFGKIGKCNDDILKTSPLFDFFIAFLSFLWNLNNIVSTDIYTSIVVLKILSMKRDTSVVRFIEPTTAVYNSFNI